MGERSARDCLHCRDARRHFFQSVPGNGRGANGLGLDSGDTSKRLLTALKILRNRHGCTLPVEIWGFAWELRRMGAVRQDLEALGNVSFREAGSSPWHPFRSKQFQIVSGRSQ